MEENQLAMADALAEAQRTAGIDRARLAMKAQQLDRRFNGKDCVDCTDPIPQERLQSQRIRCTKCESALEQRRKHFGQ